MPYPVVENHGTVVDCGSNLLSLHTSLQCGADNIARSPRQDKGQSLGESLVAAPMALLHQIFDTFQGDDTAVTDGAPTERRYTVESLNSSRFEQTPKGRDRPYPSPAQSPGPDASPTGPAVVESPCGGAAAAPFCWKIGTTVARAGPAVIENELRRLRRHYPAIVQHQIQPDEGTDRSGSDRYNYVVNGRPVVLYVKKAEKKDKDPTLMVKDGPLTQHLCDYVFQTGKNEEFDSVPQDGAALRLVPEDRRMKVPDANLHMQDPQYRLAAMHCAKHQAEIREDHARRQCDRMGVKIKREEQSSSFASGSTRTSSASLYGRW
jgi:hypothetical protein